MDHTSRCFDGWIVSSDMIWPWNLDIGNLRPQVAIKPSRTPNDCLCAKTRWAWVKTPIPPKN